MNNVFLRVSQKPLLYLFLFALFIRVFLAFVVPVDFVHSNGDVAFYQKVSEGLHDGQWYRNVLYTAPGFPTLYALFWQKTQPIPIQSLRILQAIVGAIIVSMTYLTALLITKKRGVSFGAGLIFALYPADLLQTFAISPDHLYALCFITGIFLFLKAYKSNKHYLYFFSGLSLAVGALTDPIGVYIPLIFFVWLLANQIYNRKKGLHSDFPNLIKCLIVFSAGVLLLMLPWAMRNRAVFVANGMDPSTAPFVQKGVEKEFFTEPPMTKRLIESIGSESIASITRHLIFMVFAPFQLHALDNHSPSYKSLILRAVHKEGGISVRQKTILLGKIIFSLIHIFVIIFAIIGFTKFRNKRIKLLIMAIFAYVLFASVGYGSFATFEKISPLNGFFFPFIPIWVVFSSFRLQLFFRPKRTQIEVDSSMYGNR